MTAVRLFTVDIRVTDEVARAVVLEGCAEPGEPMEPLVRETLEEVLAEEARGPRGGRYRLFGDVEYKGQAFVGDDFMRNIVTFRAQRWGRYQRPAR